MPQMKTPGPDHPITLTARKDRVRARYQNHVIADSEDVIELAEAGYKPVCYFPRADVSMEYFGKTARSSHCPYKGEASYYTLTMEGDVAENAAWSYEDPYPAMKAIAGRIAFYPNVVEAYALREGGADPDAVVLHTDEGDGASQRAPWPATATDPAAREG